MSPKFPETPPPRHAAALASQGHLSASTPSHWRPAGVSGSGFMECLGFGDSGFGVFRVWGLGVQGLECLGLKGVVFRAWGRFGFQGVKFCYYP